MGWTLIEFTDYKTGCRQSIRLYPHTIREVKEMPDRSTLITFDLPGGQPGQRAARESHAEITAALKKAFGDNLRIFAAPPVNKTPPATPQPSIAERIAEITLQHNDSTGEADTRRNHDLAEIFPSGWQILAPRSGVLIELWVIGTSGGEIRCRYDRHDDAGYRPAGVVRVVPAKHVAYRRPDDTAAWESLL